MIASYKMKMGVCMFQIYNLKHELMFIHGAERKKIKLNIHV